MKLTFDTLQECLSSFEFIDSDGEVDRKACVIFKNIRSFNKWNVAPLTSLNILTGPNSSGKSTLATIISNLRKIKFKKYIQSMADSSKGSAFVGISIDWEDYIKGSDDPDFFNTSVSYMHLMSIVQKFHDPKNRSPDIQEKLKRITVIAESKGEDWSLDLYTFIDSELVGFMTVNDDLGVGSDDEIYFQISNNFWHKLFSNKFSDHINGELLNTPIYKKTKDPYKLNKTITGRQRIDSPGYFFEIISFNDFNLFKGPDVRFGDSVNSLEEISYALVCLNILFFKPFNIFEKYSGDMLPSLRPVSSAFNLQYKFEIGWKDTNSVGNLEDISNNGASSFGNLAKEIVNEKLKLHTFKSGKKNLKEVNYWLKEILNDSHGLAYRYNSVDLIDKKHRWANITKWRDSFIKNMFVEFFLLDKKKNELGFGDVGTGISQVLPVISSIINAEHLVFLQPELHLHPKAQAVLGDLFIFSLQKHKDINARHIGVPISKVTVETHSEHLILRLLRRIKENKDKTSNKTFSNKDLSLIYVDSPRSGSEIHYIRTDESGEFIDVWPNGFFEDRYEDIFFTNK